MVVSFEGMDGVGKTTVAKKFASDNNFLHEEQKMISLLGIDKEKFLQFVKRIRTSYNQQLSAVFYTFRCMLDNDEPDKDLVIERSIASIYYFEKNNVGDEFWNSIMNLGVIPSIIFVLYATPDTRFKRIYKRDINDADLNNKEALEDGYGDMIYFLKNHGIPYVGINTEQMSIEDISALCTNIVNVYKQLGSEEEKVDFLRQMNDIYGFDYLYESNKRIRAV